MNGKMKCQLAYLFFIQSLSNFFTVVKHSLTEANSSKRSLFLYADERVTPVKIRINLLLLFKDCLQRSAISWVGSEINGKILFKASKTKFAYYSSMNLAQLRIMHEIISLTYFWGWLYLPWAIIIPSSILKKIIFFLELCSVEIKPLTNSKLSEKAFSCFNPWVKALTILKEKSGLVWNKCLYFLSKFNPFSPRSSSLDPKTSKN